MPATLRFFLDQCVPDAVGRFLNDSGHDAVYLRTVLETNTPDQLVAAQALHDDRILVSVDSDFRKMRKRLSIDAPKVKTLNVVLMTCGQIAAPARIQVALPHIVFAWETRSSRTSKPMLVEVQGSAVRILD